MTPRKPPGVSVPSWVERQIRDAQSRRAFENLSGAGQPIADLDRPRGELDWVAGYLHRENADVAALLPLGLALARELDDLPARLSRLRSEGKARAVVEDLNERIRRAHARPQDGPPVRVWPVDVESLVTTWREARAEAADPAPEPPVPAPAPRRRRWLRRSSSADA